MPDSVIPRVLPTEKDRACSVMVSDELVGCVFGEFGVPSFFARYMIWSQAG